MDIQAPSHIITGLFISVYINNKISNHAKYKRIIIIVIAFLSHGVLDTLYPLTYHPPNALWDNGFWQFFHLYIGFLSILLLYLYYRQYSIVILFSCLPDLERFLIHSINYFFSIQIKPLLHNLFFPYRNILILYGIDWSLNPIAALTEIFYFVIVGILFIIYSPQKMMHDNQYLSKSLPTKMNYQKSKDSWLDIIQIYQSALSHEQDIRQNYQNTFFALEAALFGILLALRNDYDTQFISLLSLCGIFLCWFFGVACEFRARNVDHWRMSVVGIVHKTKLAEVFNIGNYRWFAFGEKGLKGQDLIGHWFESIIITSVLLLWVYLNFHFKTNLFFQVFFYILSILWILYVFDIWKIKGKVIKSGLLY